MIRHIPNAITLLNLLSGCIAIGFATGYDLEMATFFVFLGMVFDAFDGFFARLLKVQNPLGVQLDSLADVVTFGVVPGIFMNKMIAKSLLNTNLFSEPQIQFISLFGFLITLFSALRLAKFNIDENQTDSFVGLPTPANAAFIVSLPLISVFQSSETTNIFLNNPIFLIVITLLSSWIMVSKIRLFSLKFHTWKFRENIIRYLFLFCGCLFVTFFKVIGIPLTILLYIIISLFTNKLMASKT